jgi:Integrase core domain
VKRKRFSVEQIVAVLKQAEVSVPVVVVCWQVGRTLSMEEAVRRIGDRPRHNRAGTHSAGQTAVERAGGKFHARFRDECLNVSWFENLWDARRRIAAWQNEYNERRHSSLGYQTPAVYARQRAALAGSVPVPGTTPPDTKRPTHRMRTSCDRPCGFGGQSRSRPELCTVAVPPMTCVTYAGDGYCTFKKETRSNLKLCKGLAHSQLALGFIGSQFPTVVLSIQS